VSPAEDSRHALLRAEIALPFLLVAVIWGSTWYAIKDQLADAPPSWSVTYRFAIASAGMFALAAFGGKGFGLTRAGHWLALAVGFTQFFLNYNLVYEAEVHLTSGVVAVLYGLLMLPNALLARVFLGQPVTGRFLVGSLIGIAGIALLVVHEAREAPPTGMVGYGVWLTALGLLAASAANVLQAAKAARQDSLVVLLGWAMLWGTLMDAAFAWLTAGPPVFPESARYWGGVAYLAILGSVVTFPLYFRLIRDIGPGRAAYNGVLVPVVAMGLSTLLEGYRWSALAAFGAVLALAGMVVALRGRAAPPGTP
jgi:drug/metabolite transporter (DMT)-like permease